MKYLADTDKCTLVKHVRPLIDRMKEHKRSVQRIDTNNSLAVHVKETSRHLMGEC